MSKHRTHPQKQIKMRPTHKTLVGQNGQVTSITAIGSMVVCQAVWAFINHLAAGIW